MFFFLAAPFLIPCHVTLLNVSDRGRHFVAVVVQLLRLYVFQFRHGARVSSEGMTSLSAPTEL